MWPADMPAGKRAEYWLDEIRSILSGPGGVAIAARAGGRIVGLAVLADQTFETRVLGRRMAGIRYLAAAGDPSERAAVLERLLDETLRRARERGAECVVHRTYADDAPAIHALERRGFLLMDTLMDYGFDFPPGWVPPSAPLAPDLKLRLATAEDLDGLVAVSRRAFPGHFGRYHSDERIPSEGAVRIYEEWIRSSMQGWTDWVVAAESGGAVVGYTAWKKPTEIERRYGLSLGHFTIGAIVPEHFHRGLFRALTVEGMRMMAEHARRIDGPMHATKIPVQRAFAALGWRVADARHAFHLWLEP